MSEKELTTEEIEVMILYKLARRGAWGEAYMPKDTLVNHMAKKIKRNGKRVQKVVEVLVQDHPVFLHKGGKTISLNPSRKSEILKIIKEF
jgi:CRISPR/Cas system CMR subunit Cmr4 (Cas7 group RAMP superfamily)